MYIFKKHIIDADGNYKIGYYPDGEFQKYVDETKPLYVDWLAEGNTPEEVPYVAPPEEPIEKLRGIVIDMIQNKRRNQMAEGFEFEGMQISSKADSREFILGGARKAKKSSQFQSKAILADGQVVTMSNKQLKDLEDALDDFGDGIYATALADHETALTATREQLEGYIATGGF